MRVRDAIAQPFKMIYEALTGSAMGQAYAAADDAENRGFRPLSDRFDPAMRRDLSLMSHAQMLKMAHYLFTSNPLAKFLINIPTAVVLGRQVDFCLEFDEEKLGWSKEKIDAETNRATTFLKPWWTHSSHDFGGRALKYARTYLITGELPLLVTAVNPVTGLFQVDYVDSALIRGVLGLNRLSTVPGTILIEPASVGSEPEPHEVCREDYFGGVGSMIFFRSAERLNSMRGFSYLLDVGDWIDSHDQSFFGQVDRSILGNALLHDLQITGADEAKIAAQVESFRRAASKPGGIFGHNENVKHEVKTPNLTQADSADFVRALRVFILGSKGIPEFWYGSGENSNRSTGESQNDIALKIMESFQDELAGIFKFLLNIGYDQLALNQGFPKREDGVNIYPKMPKLSEKDISRIGAMFSQTEAALDSAVAGGRLSNDTARKVTSSLVEKITGEMVDEDEEASKIKSETAEREAKAKMEMQQSAQMAADRLSKAAGEQQDDKADTQVAEAVARMEGRLSQTSREIVVAPNVTVTMPEIKQDIHAAPATVTNVPGQTQTIVVESAAPTVTVQAPQPSVVVNVPQAPAPSITVQAAPAAVTIENTVNVPPPGPREVTIKRDGEGKIKAATVEDK